MKETKKRRLPEGWKLIEFPKCIIHKSINKNKIPEKSYLKEGKYPIVDQSSKIIAGYTNNESLVYNHENPVVVFGDHTRIFKYVDFGFAIGADGTKIIHPNLDIVNPKYFYFNLVNSKFPNAGYSRHYKYLNFIEIPLPPTLDDQIAIANELERKMSEVYRMRQAALHQKEAISSLRGAILREVFPYKEGDKLPEGWKWVTISEVVEDEIKTFDEKTYLNNNFFNYIDITSVDNIKKKILTCHKIKTCEAPSRAKYIVKENDIIVSTVRPNLNSVALVENSQEGYVCSSGFCVLRLKNGYSVPYFFFYLTSPIFIDSMSKMVDGAMYPAIKNNDVIEFKISLPPTLDDQIAIARELERKMSDVDKLQQAADRELEAIKALQGAILRDTFDFKEG